MPIQENIIKALKRTTASLVAAVSLLEHSGPSAAPSDKMFTVMITDYKKAIKAGQEAIEATQKAITGDQS